MNPAVPAWALRELQEDLQDAAIDLGAAYALDPEGARASTQRAEDRYELASFKLERALELVGEAA